MAVMIPEAAGTAAGSGAGAAARLRGRRPPGRHRAPRPAARPAARPPAYQPARGQPQVAPPARPRNPSSQGGQPQVAPGRGGGKPPGSGLEARQAGDYAQRSALRLTAGAYHRIVIAEYLATVLIIAVSPFLVPRDATSGPPDAEAEAITRTVSVARPLVRLTAASLLFFLLALMASGERAGRAAAAGGGLVMLGAMLNATGSWKAAGQAFAGAQTPGVPGQLGARTAQAAKDAVGGQA
jgi:hypothetical protein